MSAGPPAGPSGRGLCVKPEGRLGWKGVKCFHLPPGQHPDSVMQVKRVTLSGSILKHPNILHVPITIRNGDHIVL